MIASVWTSLHESWQCDLLCARDGVAGYCVLGKIDVQLLRQAASSRRIPAKPFMPLPDGCEVYFDHITMLAGSRE